jgi:hypothetical protein
LAFNTADVIVLAGDIHPGVEGIIWGRKTFSGKPIVYVAGNHEYYGGHWDRMLVQLRATAAEQNVHFLENESVTIDGIRFLGATLWTDFEYFGLSRRLQCMKEVETFIPDYAEIIAENLEPERLMSILGTEKQKTGPMWWSGKLTTAHTLERHQASRAWLETELPKGDQAKTVVVTHHYPNRNSTSRKYTNDKATAGFGSNLPPDMLRQAKLWIHGHAHNSSSYRIGDSVHAVRVICNPRGYPLHWHATAFENIDFDDSLVVDV